MKKVLKLILLICLFSHRIFAQFGQITNVQIIPANPTDVDQVKAVVEVMLGSSPCTLDNAVSNINGNTIELNNFYCEGMLTTICSRTDTINLGTLTAGMYNLEVNLATGCGPYVSVDSALSNGFTVSVFSGVADIEKENIFSIFPNPTNNSIIYLQSISTNPYSIICFNSLGREVFGINSLTGSQAINLPKENGIYFIKVIDFDNQISILKCFNISK
jgi:hypothetical protein